MYNPSQFLVLNTHPDCPNDIQSNKLCTVHNLLHYEYLPCTSVFLIIIPQLKYHKVCSSPGPGNPVLWLFTIILRKVYAKMVIRSHKSKVRQYKGLKKEQSNKLCTVHNLLHYEYPSVHLSFPPFSVGVVSCSISNFLCSALKIIVSVVV
jgi:hypothetical protein